MQTRLSFSFARSARGNGENEREREREREGESGEEGSIKFEIFLRLPKEHRDCGRRER